MGKTREYQFHGGLIDEATVKAMLEADQALVAEIVEKYGNGTATLLSELANLVNLSAVYPDLERTTNAILACIGNELQLPREAFEDVRRMAVGRVPPEARGMIH